MSTWKSKDLDRIAKFYETCGEKILQSHLLDYYYYDLEHNYPGFLRVAVFISPYDKEIIEIHISDDLTLQYVFRTQIEHKWKKAKMGCFSLQDLSTTWQK